MRSDIFRIHLSRRELEPKQFDLAELAQVSDGFSGAEIEQVVVGAFYAAQARQKMVDQELLLQEIKRTLRAKRVNKSTG